MTLIKSISGIRGTIGGESGDNLTPVDVVQFASAFGTWIKAKGGSKTIVIGRDARPSGKAVAQLVANTLVMVGIDVIDLGMATTPTVEMAVVDYAAGGGIILTASHNPVQWNALKLLNEKGEFISGSDGKELLNRVERQDFHFVQVEEIGSYTKNTDSLRDHINHILSLDLVKVDRIREKGFRVSVDAVNSIGGRAVPELLTALGVDHIEKINCEPDGNFAHNPEPLPENLSQIIEVMKEGDFDLGIVVDPDVDRLALITETGEVFGEEYTLVAVADYILNNGGGSTVSNLSSSQALRLLTESKGYEYYSAAVGEVNVVDKMKECKAVIGGEGNGGVIYPELHYGRDALVGIALLLSHLADKQMTLSEYRAQLPQFVISKNKIELTEGIDVDGLLSSMQHRYSDNPISTIDGVRIDFRNESNPEKSEWVHLRKSNTEPIIRIYAESYSQESADVLAKRILSDISDLVS